MGQANQKVKLIFDEVEKKSLIFLTFKVNVRYKTKNIILAQEKKPVL